MRRVIGVLLLLTGLLGLGLSVAGLVAVPQLLDESRGQPGCRVPAAR